MAKRYEGLSEETQAYMDHILMRFPSGRVEGKSPVKRSDESIQRAYTKLEREKKWIESINQFNLNEDKGRGGNGY